MTKLMVETDDLVTPSDIARGLGIKAPRVAMWAARREQTKFPEPVLTTPSGAVKLYSKTAVLAWWRAWKEAHS